jgi:hypothetical protein
MVVSEEKIDFFLFVLIEMAFSEEEEKLLCLPFFHLRSLPPSCI